MTAEIVVFTTRQQSSPTRVNGQTPPPRQRNADVRPREYLLPDEIERLLKAARKRGRHAHRDYTIVLLGFRHGLRVSELSSLRWDMVDLQQAVLHVTRLKNGVPSNHPIRGPELRALRELKRRYPGQYLFSTDRGGPIASATIRKIIAKAGELAEIPFRVHPHMLRHSTGYYLANKGFDARAIQSYLGHRCIEHTVRYTELSSDRFNKFWED